MRLFLLKNIYGRQCRAGSYLDQIRGKVGALGGAHFGLLLGERDEELQGGLAGRRVQVLLGGDQLRQQGGDLLDVRLEEDGLGESFFADIT